MRQSVRTETINCDMTPSSPASVHRETDFEKRRGVSQVETREGFCQVHVSQLAHNIMGERLRVLEAVTNSEVSIDFLKLTPSGLSFLAPQDRMQVLESTLQGCGVHFSIKPDRCIVMVHAVNIRDEEGMIAEIVKTAIGSGVQVDHIGDGHDRLLLVMSSGDAAKLARHLEDTLSRSNA